MDEIINTDSLILEYNKNENEYRLTIFDKFYHYLDEINLSIEHLRDLKESLNKIENIDEEYML